MPTGACSTSGKNSNAPPVTPAAPTKRGSSRGSSGVRRVMMARNRNLVYDQVRQIREYIKNPHKHYELRQNKALFHQLCSSLDVIGDTDEAIIAFEEREWGD